MLKLYQISKYVQNYILICISAGLVLTKAQLQILTLIEIEKLLQENRRTLKDFSPIPYPGSYVLEHLGNRLVYDERNYDAASMKL